MKKIMMVIFMIVGFNISNALAQVPAAVPQETKGLVRTLLEANGMRANMVRIFEDIIRQAPQESQADLRIVLKGDAVIEEIIPVYAKHFSTAELKELINFYKSPVGMKNLALTPVLMTEVMEVSQKYFEKGVKSVEKPAGAADVGNKNK